MKTTLTTTKTLISLAVLAASVNVQADELETITVTATRAAQSVADTLSSVTIIDRLQIEQLQPHSTLELLTQVAGVDLSQNGGRGQNSSIFVRGTNSGHTLVLVDGIRIGSATTGSSDIQSISPSQIDRIEIVKGPRAAIWGSDAIGGVIQVFTRKASGFEAEFGIGSEGYTQLSATVGFEHGDGRSTFSINREEADGFDVRQDNQPDEDGFRDVSFTASGYQNITEQLELTYLVLANKADNEFDGYYDQVEADNSVWYLGANYSISDSNRLEFKYGQNNNSAFNFSSQNTATGLFETDREQLSLLSFNQIDPSLDVTLGLDLNNEEVTYSFDTAVNSRNNTALFASAQKRLDNIVLESALRYDDVEGIDSETTYNLGAGYELLENTKVALNHSTGFKAPSFNQLYYPNFGNPNLSAETSKTTEVLVKHQFSSGSLALSLYNTDVDNLIDNVQKKDGSGSEPRNIDSAEIRGAELEVSLNYGGLHHFASLAYIDAEDSTSGERLIRRAREQFNYSVTAQLGEIDFSISYSYKGNSTDQVYGVGVVELAGYSLVNANLGYALSDQLELNFKVNNLFDKEYFTVNSYNSQGQSFYFGVNYKL